MKAGGKKSGWSIAVRLFVTISCCAVLFSWIDVRVLWSSIASLPPAAWFSALLLQALIVFVLGWRWRSIVAAVGQMATYGWAARLTFATTFFNMILPLSIGGDIGRVWLGRHAGVDLRTGLTVAILDRLAGLIGLGLLLCASAIFLPAGWLPKDVRLCMILVFPMMLVGLWLIAAFSGAGVSHWLALQWAGDVAEKAKLFLRQPWPLCLTVTQSLIGHVMSVIVVFVCARGLGIPLTFGYALLLVPIMLLATMLPFSIGGWGLREASAIAVLSLAGITTESALALALIFGMTQLIVGGAGTLACFGWAGVPLRRVRS
jgi:uncharacterized membrane protein YbhN (UPF0104 family)